jgi:NADPH:quinone reductase-like Zn-dependent oxidoreductase
VKRITGGNGARVTFDPVAGEGVETLAQAAAEGGIIILYGALAHSATPFPLFAALRKGLTLRGYTLFEVVGNPERMAKGKQYVQRAGERQAEADHRENLPVREDRRCAPVHGEQRANR